MRRKYGLMLVERFIPMKRVRAVRGKSIKNVAEEINEEIEVVRKANR